MSNLMKRNIFSPGKKGFSLIEVVLAVALLSFTIVAVIGLLGTTSRAVSDVEDYTTAAQISEAILDELLRLDFDDLALNLPVPIKLYGNRAGDRVVMSERVEFGGSMFDADERRAFPPRDWYYKVSITRVGAPAAANVWEQQVRYDPAYSSYLPLKVEVSWPHHLPRGIGAEDFVPYEEEQQRYATYYVSVPKRP